MDEDASLFARVALDLARMDVMVAPCRVVVLAEHRDFAAGEIMAAGFDIVITLPGRVKYQDL
jgi:galactokinase